MFAVCGLCAAVCGCVVVNSCVRFAAILCGWVNVRARGLVRLFVAVRCRVQRSVAAPAVVHYCALACGLCVVACGRVRMRVVARVAVVAGVCDRVAARRNVWLCDVVLV